MSNRTVSFAAGMIGILVASAASATAPPVPGGSLGCCLQTVPVDSTAEPQCSVLTEEQCTGEFEPGTVLEFRPGDTCNALFDACIPFVPPALRSSTSLAHRPEECFTDKAAGVLGVTQGQGFAICGQVCNETQVTLNVASLNIDPFFVPEFTNQPIALQPGSCATVRKTVSPFVFGKFIGDDPFLRVINQWCLSTHGNCNIPRLATDGETGGPAGPALLVMDAQSALVVRQPAHGAPALGGWLLSLLAAGLAGVGVRRLMHRRA
jgi:hypothetical protein